MGESGAGASVCPGATPAMRTCAASRRGLGASGARLPQARFSAGQQGQPMKVRETPARSTHCTHSSLRARCAVQLCNRVRSRGKRLVSAGQ